MERITCSPERLMNQAGKTVNDYLHNAVQAVERQFGTGSARKFPQIVAALVQAQAQDFHTSIVAKACGDFEPYIMSIENAISQVARNTWPGEWSSTTVLGSAPLALPASPRGECG